jgi:hypothetical protein
LDKIEPYSLFRDALLSKSSPFRSADLINKLAELQQEQPQLWQNLLTNLGPEEQQVIQGVVHQADAIAAATAAETAAAEAANGAA